jgi:hypothetical protein
MSSLQQAALVLEDRWGAEWGDSDRWELGPAIPPDAEPLPPELAPADPDPADVEWLNTQPSLDDLAELEAWLSHLSEGYPREYPDAGYLTDRDVMTATGSCG